MGIRKTMLRPVLWAALALVLLFAAWLWFLWRDSCLLYEDSGSVGGMDIYVNQIGHRAFAGEYCWDGDMDHRTIRVPDEVEGCPVTALGGYMGAGAPCPFGVRFPADPNHFWTEIVQDRHRAADGTLPVTDLVFTLELGPRVKELRNVGLDNGPYYTVDAAGNDVFYRAVYSVVCDEENPIFYAQNGRLYYRKDGALVTAFAYPEL